MGIIAITVAEISCLRCRVFLNPRGELIAWWTVQAGQEIENTALRDRGKEAGTCGEWQGRFGWVLGGTVRQWEENSLLRAGLGHRCLKSQGSKKKEKSVHC